MWIIRAIDELIWEGLGNYDTYAIALYFIYISDQKQEIVHYMKATMAVFEASALYHRIYDLSVIYLVHKYNYFTIFILEIMEEIIIAKMEIVTK